jgi:DNA polymerase III delta subunit
LSALSISGNQILPMVYLLIGQDSISKDAALEKLKQQTIPGDSPFNLDTLYGKDTSLKRLQELLLFFPFQANRMVVVRNAHELKDEVKKFLVEFVKTPRERLVLVLDVERNIPKDAFLEGLKANCRTSYFREERQWTVFDLARAIEGHDCREALGILNKLLSEGEKPERLLGGLRASWQKRINSPRELERRLRLLLDCDLAIKTGRLKPALVLERLVIGLSAGRDPA